MKKSSGRSWLRVGLVGVSLLTVAAASSDELPAPPELKSVRGLAPGESTKIAEGNEKQWSAWEDRLTPQQLAIWNDALGKNPAGAPLRLGMQGLPQADSGYDWRLLAQQAGLKSTEIAQLADQRVLLEDVALKQSFEAYTEPRRPVFITSDTLLNAFHVLFEDSFRELELHRSAELRRHLENVLTKSREQQKGSRNDYALTELQPGWHHAQMVVGPALRLLGTPRDFFDEPVRDEIDRQVEKIRVAASVELPAWLGQPTARLLGVDYRVCRPIGFYAETEYLQNYFRAVRWLQVIPLRADRDTELTAMGLLAYATMESREGARVFFENYHALIGRPDDPDLSTAPYEFHNLLNAQGAKESWSERLVEVRRWLVRDLIMQGEWSKLRNTRQLPVGGEEKLATLQFRVLSAYRLPDALLLSEIGRSGQLPPGLAIAVLVGSEFARGHLSDKVSPEQLATGLQVARDEWHPGDRPRPHRGGENLYGRYLDMLTTLTAKAEPDAPEFMRSRAWAAKSCQTVLAGWSQLRHTFTLQAKDAKMFKAIVDTPPGFIEPNPEFFRSLANLVEWAAGTLEASDVFSPSVAVTVAELRGQIEFIEKLGLVKPTASAKDLESLSPEQWDVYETILGGGIMDVIFDNVREFWANETQAEFLTFHRKLLARLHQQMEDYQQGRKAAPAGGIDTLRARWDSLKSVTRRLEAMVHKQLRQQPWTSEEATFIRQFGEKQAFVMGYYGNSWLTPRDDAPRWATVASDPASDKMLAVATGRARLIHVLYPWKGMDILCTGSVMSYYEYAAPKALTDDEWRQLLDSDAKPALPEWIAPYLAR
jgi:hypothetical protein